MPSLQELIDRYRNGEDDVDETTAVPKHGTYGGRRAANSNAFGSGDGTGSLFDDKAAEDDDDANAEGGADRYPIFIPSKGRYDPTRAGTCPLLARSRIAFTVVVEPQEATSYRTYLSQLEGYDQMLHAVAVLPASHQGVSYVRNHIAKHLAPASGWFWQMDDDIRGFSQSLGNRKNTPVSTRAFFRLFSDKMKQYPTAALFSAEYEMFSWNYGPGDVAINSYNNIAKLFKRECMPSVVLPDSGAAAAANGASTSSWPPSESDAATTAETLTPAPVGQSPGDVYRFKVREDYDIVLRMIENGHCVVRFKDLSFRVPAMSECAGGMTEYYTKQRDDIREQNRLFVAAWPTVAREVLKGAGKDLRFDIKVNWAVLNPAKGDPAAVLQARDKAPTVESLLITDEDAAVASKLRETSEADTKTSSGLKTSTWKSKGRGGGGEKEKEEELKKSSRNRSQNGKAVRSRAVRKRARRAADSDDDDADDNASGIDDASASDKSLSESDAESFDSDDDDSDVSDSDLSTLPSSGDDDSDVFEDEFEDEATYFEVMESFYNPRKAAKREREREAAERRALEGHADDDDNANNGGNTFAKKERTPRPKAAPKPKLPPEEKPPTGWAGYAMVMWRDVEPEAAEGIGLTHLDPKDKRKVSVGSTVAFVPLSYEVTPSVMIGTIISVHDDDHTVQIAPGRKYRGVPLQTIAADRLYEGDCDPVKCAAALDALLQPPSEAIVQVTRSNVKSLVELAKGD